MESRPEAAGRTGTVLSVEGFLPPTLLYKQSHSFFAGSARGPQVASTRNTNSKRCTQCKDPEVVSPLDLIGQLTSFRAKGNRNLRPIPTPKAMVGRAGWRLSQAEGWVPASTRLSATPAHTRALSENVSSTYKALLTFPKDVER